MYLNIFEKRKLKNFLEEYHDYYSFSAQAFWDNEFNPIKSYNKDFVNQTLTYLFPNKYVSQIYLAFIELLENKYTNLPKKKIIEVASGYIPGLVLALKKRNYFDFPITCYDPKLFDLKIPGIYLKKEEFTLDTDISSSDLLIAHCPCEALDAIVEQTIKNKIEMCVQTCPCGHDFGMFFSSRNFRYYIDSLFDNLSVLTDDGFIIEKEKTDSYRHTSSPVIIVRKRMK